jgi:hypothetical protein
MSPPIDEGIQSSFPARLPSITSTEGVTQPGFDLGEEVLETRLIRLAAQNTTSNH